MYKSLFAALYMTSVGFLNIASGYGLEGDQVFTMKYPYKLKTPLNFMMETFIVLQPEYKKYLYSMFHPPVPVWAGLP